MAPLPMDSKPDEVPVPLSNLHLSRGESSDIAVEDAQSPLERTHSSDSLNEYNQQQISLWDDSSHRNISRDGYDRVGVLMIKWEDGLDQLRCAEEVKQLADVFKNKYNFDVRHLELHNRAKPQHQLSAAVAKLVEDFDKTDSRNLMILYYAGHGAWNRNQGHFLLQAVYNTTAENRSGRSAQIPRVSWNTAEQPLWESDSDILVIFDACYAAKLLQRNVAFHRKTFEVLCASDDLTERPGPESFTAALIKVLSDVPDPTRPNGHGQNSYTTQDLYQRICKLRCDNEPVLWNRLQRENGAIRLAPIVPLRNHPASEQTKRRQTSQNATQLTLKFQLGAKRKLDEADIDVLTTSLPAAFRQAGITCDRISFVSHHVRRDSLAFENAVGSIMVAAKLHKWAASSSKRRKTVDLTAADDNGAPVLAAIPVIIDPSSVSNVAGVTFQDNKPPPRPDDAGSSTPGPRTFSKQRTKSG